MTVFTQKFDYSITVISEKFNGDTKFKTLYASIVLSLFCIIFPRYSQNIENVP